MNLKMAAARNAKISLRINTSIPKPIKKKPVMKAPLAIEIGRKALAEAEDMSLSEALDLLCERLSDVASTEDAVEGLTAFMQKRQPVWKRR